MSSKLRDSWERKAVARRHLEIEAALLREEEYLARHVHAPVCSECNEPLTSDETELSLCQFCQSEVEYVLKNP